MTVLAVKSTLAVVVAFLMVMAARRTRASLRHMILAALFAFLLLLPLAQLLAPAVPIEVDRAVLTAAAERTMGSSPSLSAPADAGGGLKPALRFGDVFAGAYVGGVVLLFVSLGAGLWRLRRVSGRSEVWLDGTARMNELARACGIRRPALVVLSRETNVPLTFGFRMSTIVLPAVAASWDDEALRRALRHELEHVRREDWLLQLVARAACALYWPNPLVWMAWRRFCFEAERACDDAVIGTFAGAADYAGQLVSLARSARRMTAVPALGMASRSRLAARVDALLDPAQRRGPTGKIAAPFAIATTLLLLVVIAPTRLVAAVSSAGPHDEPREDVLGIHFVDRSPLGEALVRSAEQGRTDDVERLVRAGLDVNIVVHGDGTALIGAARYGRLSTVEYLLENGADVNLASPGDGNPLIAAAKYGDPAVVELLLDRGARINEIARGDENALMQAVRHRHVDLVALLIARGADVNARAVEGTRVRTPLRLARGHAEIERMLRTAGARD